MSINKLTLTTKLKSIEKSRKTRMCSRTNGCVRTQRLDLYQKKHYFLKYGI